MKREVVSLAVGIVLLAVGCSGDSRPVASSSPASVDTRADVEHQLETTGGKVAAWLRAEPWPLDGTTTSLTAVTAITGASYDNDPAKAQTKQDDVMRLLDAVKASSWYDGRPSDAEKASIAAAFTLASKLPAEVAKTNARTGEPLYPQLEKFSWVDLLADALKQRHFTSVAGAVEPTITLLSADTSDDAAADETLLYASSNLSEIESLAGSYRTPYLLFVLDPGLDPDLCGQAFPDESLILIQPTCLGAEVVVHEMTHIATPSIGFAVWYEEGTAYLVAAKLSGGLAPDKLAETATGDYGRYVPAQRAREAELRRARADARFGRRLPVLRRPDADHRLGCGLDGDQVGAGRIPGGRRAQGDPQADAAGQARRRRVSDPRTLPHDGRAGPGRAVRRAALS